MIVFGALSAGCAPKTGDDALTPPADTGKRLTMEDVKKNGPKARGGPAAERE